MDYPKSGPGTEGPDAFLSEEAINKINKKILEDNRNARLTGLTGGEGEYAVPNSKQLSEQDADRI